jgi:hypothetical protein
MRNPDVLGRIRRAKDCRNGLQSTVCLDNGLCIPLAQNIWRLDQLRLCLYEPFSKVVHLTPRDRHHPRHRPTKTITTTTCYKLFD